MRDIFLFAFILSIPALAALGHDVYMAYNNTHLDPGERFHLYDLGVLWIDYHPASYNWVIENTDAIIWNGFIDPVLQYSAVYVAAVPLALYLAITLFMKIFGLGGFEGRGLFSGLTMQGKTTSYKSGQGEKKRVKYKRK
ncbi:MAG: hypothetical protein H6867_02560 [Rhodospirillales bacterium]|nr:hypothetical protein [Rhodospirillales bacterium]MCB9997072.1 hypothetical protein [Rhodospirillales bacterium]